MKNPNQTIIDSIGSNSIELISESSELLLDTTLESGILKDIPVFGSLLKLAKIGNSVRDFLFVQKLKAFLLQVSRISQEERNNFINKHLSNQKDRTELGEKLLNTLDVVDSSKKADLIGKTFGLYLQGEIKINQFYDLIYTIENFKIHYLELFIETCLHIENDNKANMEIIDHFFVCGLLHSKRESSVVLYNRNEQKYSNDRLTPLGIIFLEKIIEYDQVKLKSRFINRIINLTPRPYKIRDKYEFIESVSKSELISKLEQVSFFDILQFSKSVSFASNYELENFNRIQHNSATNKYDLFKFIYDSESNETK